MPKQKKAVTEFRNYYLPIEFPVLLLTGDHWRISDKPSDHLHFHNCLEIGFCHEGSGTMQIKKQSLPFQANDIVFIARNIPHTTYSSSGTDSLWSYLMIDLAEIFDSFAPGYSHLINQLISNSNTALVIHGNEHPKILSYVTQLIHEISYGDGSYQLYARTLLLSLLIEFSRSFGHLSSSSESDVAEPSHTLAIFPALEYIKHHYMTQFSVEYLADLCGLSPTHFRRVFHTAMDTSPLEYLNTVRITKACQLLRGTEDSILNISESVGFHSISSFNRYFDRLIHMSPREYRRTSTDDASLKNAKIMKFNGWMEPDL